MKKKSNSPAKPSSLHQNGGNNGTSSACNSTSTPSPQSAKVVGIHIQQSKRSTSFPTGSLLTAILPDFDPNADDDGIARMQIDRGARFAVSNICLDPIPREAARAKVLFRYSYRSSDGDVVMRDRKDAPWICLCNFLVGMMPMVSLNLTIDGPCSVEWKLDVEGNSGVVDGQHSTNKGAHIVGNVELIPDVVHKSVSCSAGEITDRGDVTEERNVVDKGEKDGELVMPSEKLADVKHGDDNASDSIGGSGNNNGRHDAGDEGKSKKRKLSVSDNNNAEGTSQIIKKLQQNQTDNATTATNGEESTTVTVKKLTKKERKKLAEQKAKQLEETLAAARDNSTSSRKEDDKEIIAEQDDGEDKGENEAGEPPTKKAKKKKKKKQTSKADGDDASDESGNAKSKPLQAKPTSLTSQRRLPNGILLRDILIGTGAPIAPGRRVSLHYTGSLLSSGKVFDKNHSKTHPLVFRQGTGEVIRGLERGLEGMKVGGERVITVPSRLGYGEKGVDGKIPGGEDLVFEVKVLKVG